MSRLTSLFLIALVGCESNLISNEPLPHVDVGLFGDAGKGVKRDARAPVTSDDDEEPEPSDEEPSDDEAPVEGEKDATVAETEDGAVAETDAGEEPMASVIKGTGLESACSSYGLPKGGQCAGYFCGVTVDALTAEYKTGGKCDTTPERICEGQLTRDVGKCARDTKSNPLNAFDTDEQLRVKIAACVTKLPANADIEEECLSCFLDAAQCASDFCLTQCLTGDSKVCDDCRLENNCNQPVPTCAGFPTPF